MVSKRGQTYLFVGESKLVFQDRLSIAEDLDLIGKDTEILCECPYEVVVVCFMEWHGGG